MQRFENLIHVVSALGSILIARFQENLRAPPRCHVDLRFSALPLILGVHSVLFLLLANVILLKILYILIVHPPCHIVGLPFLQRKANTLVIIILAAGLVLMVLYSDELAVHSLWIQAQRDQAWERYGLWNQTKGPLLLVLELKDFIVATCHFVSGAFAFAEELGQREPLACDFVSVVCIAKEVVVDTIGCVAFNARARRVA